MSKNELGNGVGNGDKEGKEMKKLRRNKNKVNRIRKEIGVMRNEISKRRFWVYIERMVKIFVELLTYLQNI